MKENINNYEEKTYSTDTEAINDKDLEKYIREFYFEWHDKECEDSLTAAIFHIRRLDALCWNIAMTIMSVLNKKPGYCLSCGNRFWADLEHYGDFESAIREHGEWHQLNLKSREEA